MTHSPQQRFPALFAPRAPDSHKGDHGTLAVIGGAQGMSGALVLAAGAALMSGCGRVFAAFCQHSLPAPWIDRHPEIMLATTQNIFAKNAVDTWAIGCGMGTGHRAHRALSRVINHCREHMQPLVIDADALNLLSREPALGAALKNATACTVLTPHPAEAARLLACHTRDIQKNRRQSVLDLCDKYRAYIVLKGHRTFVAAPDGTMYENDSGNPALATAGSGDVLTGMIAALLAQKIPPDQAVCGAVWLHGAAADAHSMQGIPLTGLLAGEIAPMARQIRRQLSQMHCDINTN